ncbi:IS110 family transposase [Petrocella sp. FN5]|uniref:IS110 family transposase n=1 Tax=Petrocella sp. FN5 TaxID=3032002 RepID=UPI0023D99794|nr:transposase [Petrocella sp. FN5]MDF1618716.1 transposase [Petrocella sp. FN5]
MIIIGGYHGIRLLEREVQLHDLCWIDIAKLNYFASALSSDGDILIEPFKFTNDDDGLQQLLFFKLNFFEMDSLIIGLESTAHYGDNIVRFLVATGSRCVFLTLCHVFNAKK